MLVIISYDIKNDRTRTRFANRLKDFGPRVQLSVFEADVAADEFFRLKQMIAEVEFDKDDTVRLYRLCSECAGKIELWGSGEITADKDFYIV